MTKLDKAIIERMADVGMKPCPFCGSEASGHGFVANYEGCDCNQFYVGCSQCFGVNFSARGPGTDYGFDTETDAINYVIEKWNHRKEE